MGERTTKRLVTVRVAHSWEEAERLDREWWAQFTPDQKVAMLWGMTMDYLAFKGIVDEPRLQRSVCRFQRRRS
jgi:hypothetical protein